MWYPGPILQVHLMVSIHTNLLTPHKIASTMINFRDVVKFKEWWKAQIVA